MVTYKVLYMILYLTPVKQASVVPFGRREEESLEVVVFFCAPEKLLRMRTASLPNYTSHNAVVKRAATFH